ncbi:hypothetical protein [Flavobacterium channae]|uniref:hypothetical protein n=1 Tax=Flavobacterium channae TaxID=2897181 RepID=UPI001E441F4E|nr:hypothetical protein [Flavobacterium channae]UGS23278.1 hypothetical protein LOS89_11020 [Flavobacterium channae]
MKKEIVIPVFFGLFTAFFASYTSPYDIIDIGKASEIVLQNLIIPIIILSGILSFLVYKFYSKFIKQENERPKKFDRVFAPLVYSILIFFSLFFFTRFLVVVSNALIGNEQIIISGNVIDVYHHTGRGGDYYNIEINDEKLNRKIELRTEIYDNQEFVNYKLKIGYWGIIYGD